jgi:glycopeptide antibiotics resistance protein
MKFESATDTDVEHLWPRRWHLCTAAMFFTAIAIYVSFLPFEFRSLHWKNAVLQFSALPRFDLATVSRADFAANVLLFIPISFLWLGTLAADKSRLVSLGWAPFVMLCLFAFSLAIEFGQYWFPGRTVSANDVLAQTIGGIVGVSVWWTVGPISIRWMRRYGAVRHVPGQIEWLLQAYLLGLVLYSVMPLDLTISIHDLYDKFKRGYIKIIPFSYSYPTVTQAIYAAIWDVVLFVPVGILAAIGLRKKNGAPRDAVYASVMGVSVVCAIEAAQLLVYSRVTDTSDIILGSLGIFIGVGLSRALMRQPESQELLRDRHTGAWKRSSWLLVAIVLYVSFLGMRFLTPFDFIDDPVLIHARLRTCLQRVPFDFVRSGSEFNAIHQVLLRLGLYAPLGALCGLMVFNNATNQIWRRLLLIVGLIVIAGLSLVIELGQVLVPSRVADLSEIPLCVFGAALGMIVVSRLYGAGKRSREFRQPAR